MNPKQSAPAPMEIVDKVEKGDNPWVSAMPPVLMANLGGAALARLGAEAMMGPALSPPPSARTEGDARFGASFVSALSGAKSGGK